MIKGAGTRLPASRTLWFVATLLVLTPVLVAAHSETGRSLQEAFLYSVVTAVAIAGLNAALAGRRTHG
jgi:hypothetical protein